MNWLISSSVGVIYLATIGRFFWLDLFYGIGGAVGLPTFRFYLGQSVHSSSSKIGNSHCNDSMAESNLGPQEPSLFVPPADYKLID